MDKQTSGTAFQEVSMKQFCKGTTTIFVSPLIEEIY